MDVKAAGESGERQSLKQTAAGDRGAHEVNSTNAAQRRFIAAKAARLHLATPVAWS